MSGWIMHNMAFTAGQTLTVTGVPTTDSRFHINIGHTPEELALHLNPRFDDPTEQHIIVCNSFEGGNWCEEQRTKSSFPFHLQEQFQVQIKFSKQEFLVTLPNGQQIHFPNRLGAKKYDFINYAGDVKNRGIKID